MKFNYICLFLVLLFISGEQCLADENATEFNECDFSLVGWAAVAGSTTGGEGGAIVTVTNATELEDALNDTNPMIIEFSGVIEGVFQVSSDKTLRGADENATIAGSLVINGTSNIILQNFNVDSFNSTFEEGISITNSAHHIWIDHLAVFDGAKGNINIKRKSNYVTISWTKFYYDQVTSEQFSNLVGDVDSYIDADGNVTDDSGYLEVTFHHCWWGQNVQQRMPRVRYGKVHTFNNYYASSGNKYCIRAGKGSSVVVENNYFDQVSHPHELYYKVVNEAEIFAEGNIYDGIQGKIDDTASGFIPPYVYDLDEAVNIPSIVTQCSGPQSLM
mmetsp:Transcript_9412/g.15119  ORF Transcript_9412/g.15119 Transcript_9412/m.15119 type:complete len:331 (-) Transcript_9412:101-1093(-)